MGENRQARSLVHSSADGPVMLVVGDLAAWAERGHPAPMLSGFTFVGFEDVTPELLCSLSPDVVLSALFGSGFDAIDLARRLAEHDFRGRYRAVATGLRDPEVVREEIRRAAPGLDFDLFLIDPG